MAGAVLQRELDAYQQALDLYNRQARAYNSRANQYNEYVQSYAVNKQTGNPLQFAPVTNSNLLGVATRGGPLPNLQNDLAFAPSSVSLSNAGNPRAGFQFLNQNSDTQYTGGPIGLVKFRRPDGGFTDKLPDQFAVRFKPQELQPFDRQPVEPTAAQRSQLQGGSLAKQMLDSERGLNADVIQMNNAR